MLTDLGVRWVRDAIEWAEVEPSPNRFLDFSPSLKRRLEFYKDHNIGLVALLSLENAKAYPAEASNPGASFNSDAFGRYAAFCAVRLKALGIRFVIELGNEPHNSKLLPVFGGAWNGHPPSPWVDHYVQMVRAAERDVKNVTPSVKLLTDDDMWVLHYWFLDAGLPSDLDGFAIHPYTATPEKTAVAQETDWVRPFSVVDPDRTFASAIRRLKSQGELKLGHVPEVWVTEWGWPVGGSAGNSVSDDTLVGYLPRAFILAAASGVKVTCWFSSQDSVDGPMGLTRNDGQRRGAYQALKVLTGQVGESVLQGNLGSTAASGAGVYAFLFDARRQRTLVIWETNAADLTLALPSQQTNSAVDALGRSLVPDRKQDGLDYFKIGDAPIYVSGRWSDDALKSGIPSVAKSQ